MASDYFMLGAGVLAGLVMHQGVFIEGEWHIQAPRILACHIWPLTLVYGGLYYSKGLEAESFFYNLISAGLGYILALVSSVICYHLFFHPLAKAGFRGPLLARVTKLWHAWACRRSQNHLVLADLHKRYGDFVRTGKGI